MTPTAVTTYTTQTRTVPYLTTQQYKLAPTPIPWDTLAPGGTLAQSEDQLEQLIERASGWVDSICMQVLQATVDTEQRTAYANGYGQIIIHPRYHPVMQLTDFWSGVNPLSMAEMSTLSNCSVEPTRIIVSQGGVPFMSSQGPLQFGGAFSPSGYPMFVRYSYINGYPVTTLAVQAAAGVQQIQVRDPTGIIPGLTPLAIRDGAPSENLTVTAVSGNTVSLASPLAYTHQPGAAVTALPQDVEEAVILATTALAKARGNMAIVAQSTQGKQINDPLGAGTDLAAAEAILVRGDYVRVAR